ncbi:MAG TPA: DUF1415 domain-containing protein [Saprospiraceae bacterium]|nr:DUF1415 domain-containing protein [Saprospiraceae bacterium]HMP24526.1 DUF1415 domain-containing protein [Saprospiraceae bacterium]
MLGDAIVINQTKAWIAQVVIGCNFCPFAGTPFKQERIHYEVVRATGMEDCLEALIAACLQLDHEPDVETTLLIYPGAFQNFENYLEVFTLAEGLLELQGYEGVYQVAGFHPEYCFADAPADDPANYTNRSPYPMLHLLREESVTRAVASTPLVEQIPARNMDYARQRGLVYMQALRAACFLERN